MTGDDSAPGPDAGDGDDATAEAHADADADVVLTLPDHLRAAFKEPLGPVETDAAALLARVDGPLVTVGDVVTAHVLEAGRQPDVALVDGRTERESVPDDVAASLDARDTAREVRVTNPAATLTADLLVALRDALAAADPVTIVVEGEEDLAAVPAVLVAPEGASVVYGQPGEGMVHVAVTAESKADLGELAREMDGDAERLFSILDGT